MALRDLATHSGRLGATWAIHQCGLARLWLAYIGFDWLDMAALGDQPMQLIRLASWIELTAMKLRDSATHSGRLRATWVTCCAALRDWLPRTGFDCLNLHALGDQPIQLIRFASSTELTHRGANENPNA